MNEDQVVALMRSSMNEPGWNANCDRVKREYGGCYPDFWFRRIVMSGLAAAISATWGGDADIHVHAPIPADPVLRQEHTSRTLALEAIAEEIAARQGESLSPETALAIGMLAAAALGYTCGRCSGPEFVRSAIPGHEVLGIADVVVACPRCDWIGPWT